MSSSSLSIPIPEGGGAEGEGGEIDSAFSRISVTPTTAGMCHLADGTRRPSASSSTSTSSSTSSSPSRFPPPPPPAGGPPPLSRSPSRLSTSRPTSLPPSRFSIETPPISSPLPQSTRTHSPSPLDTPILLNVLSASDDESILVIVVEEEKDDHEDGTGWNLPGLTSSSSGGMGKGKKKGGRLFGGSQGGDIHVWDLRTLALRARLCGHDSAVLALQLVPERGWLISSSGDGTVRVWHTATLSPLYLIHPPHDNVGDILSLAWISTSILEGVQEPKTNGTGRLYAGCQDTCIQWIDLPPSFHLSQSTSAPASSLPSYLSTSHSHSASSSPPIHRAPNKFFDSLSVADRPRSRLGLSTGQRNSSSNSLTSLNREFEAEAGISGGGGGGGGVEVVELQFEECDRASWAHYGYVYCLTLGKSNERNVLVSGSGDEKVKLWTMTSDDLLPLATLPSTADAVLTLAVRDSTLFAGHQGGVVRVWDLDTFTCIRDLHPHTHDILTLTVIGDYFYSGASDGTIQRWDKSFHVVASWKGHDSIVLSSTMSEENGRHLITGGNDAVIKIWDIIDDDQPVIPAPTGFHGQMFHALSKFISFKTIACEEHREDCRQGAQFLKRLLRDLGAESSLLPGAPGKNHIVMGIFQANAPRTSESPRKKRVLCYAHYDVVAADDKDKWTQDPFEMMGKNGWVYGRGVSDNKGPLLAIAAAASDLRAKQALDVDLVMVVEGEEETGSAGFQDAIRKNREAIGDIDVILVSNSYWIGEDIPCLTFGLRGVIHATVTIRSDQPDLHSGMQGGVVSEPLVDMVRLLASLTDSDGRVRIPGFLNDVRKLGAEESALYDAVMERCSGTKADKLHTNSHIDDPRRSLVTRWRQPALSIHKIDVTGPSQKTLIPSKATANVSIRIVPDQSLLDIVQQLKSHLNKAFGSLRTRNTLTVDIDHVADWWLGDVDSKYFKAFADCIKAEWGTAPLYIREGGSIPSLPFLEREFQADACHFPMGLNSDAAHLPDERIPVINLERGRAIIARWLTAISTLPEDNNPV